jgi:molybdopterin converting factor small subunit
MPEIQILLFGPAKDAQGEPSVALPVESFPVSISAVREQVSSKFPKLAAVVATSIFAVANRLTPRSAESMTVVVSEDQEVVLVPPVSGG